MGTISRRQLLVGAGAGAVGTAAALGAAPLTALASDDEDHGVEGSWDVTVHVTSPNPPPPPATFEVLYAFAKGGVFTRIDGRNGVATIGTWKRAQAGGIVFSSILFNFNAGVRNGAILGNFAAKVAEDGTLVGTFTAKGIQGFSFSRAGTFTGTRTEAVGP